jgi:predicted O-methyltransferase YrrM
MRPALRWLMDSDETSNFTYEITERSKRHIACALAVALDRTVAEILGYMDELEIPKVGRRICWYAAARALKPRLVVETGVDRGLGASTICTALIKNRAAGFPGRYVGTDINPAAGALFKAPYTEVGAIAYGDSIETLKTLPEIDIFINDSDHSAIYEAREYETIKLAPGALVIGDNAHVTDALHAWSMNNGRSFLCVREEPIDHWYLGAAVALSFIRDSQRQ